MLKTLEFRAIALHSAVHAVSLSFSLLQQVIHVLCFCGLKVICPYTSKLVTGNDLSTLASYNVMQEQRPPVISIPAASVIAVICCLIQSLYFKRLSPKNLQPYALAE